MGGFPEREGTGLIRKMVRLPAMLIFCYAMLSSAFITEVEARGYDTNTESIDLGYLYSDAGNASNAVRKRKVCYIYSLIFYCLYIKPSCKSIVKNLHDNNSYIVYSNGSIQLMDHGTCMYNCCIYM